MKQLGLFDWKDRYARIDKNGDPLLELSRVIPWDNFRPILSNIFKKIKKSNAGAKPYDVVLMFKILILQSLYNLSDDGMEYQILDRLSFMRFLGLDAGDKVPDSKTIWLFREKLKGTSKNIIFQIFLLTCKSLANEQLFCHKDHSQMWHLTIFLNLKSKHNSPLKHQKAAYLHSSKH